MSKFYIISGAVINGKPVNFKHSFSTRDGAINAYFNEYEKDMFNVRDLQVETEIANSKHDIVYVCSPAGNRFEVDRIVVD
jgi:hypothetical protein